MPGTTVTRDVTTSGRSPAGANRGGARVATRHHQIVIVGGGTAGISVASRLLRERRELDIAIIEPSEHHFYQPLWTLVGGGVLRKEETLRQEAALIPAGATWIRDAAVALRPEENVVVVGSGEWIRYDALVLAPGLRLDWGSVTGLEQAIGLLATSSGAV